ncbi:uncharacterized protein KY384_008630 [Bacidia gigantensis]|uniref:uncharacterized protein n=1 Tax=Bacidia gigantensis TaxID=2732470 RepID=UPI001D04D82B|nr:uncharacterized protein KY384_008630 [Bacidia gigantensis]KAG8527200.1 hypothetical protein KY384_008630 [Bacidia gigantensis]
MPSPPRIAIIGAGPAGCTLARILLSHSIPSTIFEGEASLSVRAQGGTLDLHPSTGQAALKECGIWSDFLKYARYDGEALKVVDKNLVVYLGMPGAKADEGGWFGGSRGRPEIDRVRLRQILVESLPEGVIRWGKRVRGFDAEKMELTFDDGVEGGWGLVVGADGAWSKIRPALSEVKPYYVGLGGFDMVVPNARETCPELAEFVNRGTVFGYSDGKTLMAQQRGDESLIIYAWGARDEKWMEECGFDVKNAKQVKEYLEGEYKEWKDPLKKALQVARDDEIVARCMYQLPVDHRWEGRHGVTLVGDAAHLLTPFAGEGVNLAMEDSMKLAYAIIDSTKAGDSSDKLQERIRKFELDMFARSAPISALSKRQMETMFFTEGAPFTTIHDWVCQALGGLRSMHGGSDSWYLGGSYGCCYGQYIGGEVCAA